MPELPARGFRKRSLRNAMGHCLARHAPVTAKPMADSLGDSSRKRRHDSAHDARAEGVAKAAAVEQRAREGGGEA